MYLRKRIYLIAAILWWASFTITAQQRAMTYNLRYDNPGDGPDRWELRREGVLDLLRYYRPQILGIQEGLYHQIEYLDEGLPSYAYVGMGRDGGAREGEFSAIFVDTTHYAIREHQTFWLSDSPEVPSVGWDAALNRICTYVLLEEKASGQRL
ncbi:MAG: hypothetical protein R3350_09370, partial [Saprospiraceae bacterium]|nr:hypothetical protein [Saprospiraceae bacterium]